MDKNKKRRLVFSSITLVVGVILSLYISTILHEILSTKQLTNITLPNLKDSIKSIVLNEQHLKLFLCFIALSLLSSVALYFSSDGGYKSELQMITPVIYTPIRVGQNQHGSARWLTDKEKETAFESFYMDPKDKHVRELIDSGYKDLKDGDRS